MPAPWFFLCYATAAFFPSLYVLRQAPAASGIHTILQTLPNWKESKGLQPD